MNKKADVEYLVKVLLALFALVLIGFTIKTWATAAEPKEAEILCHDSLAVRAATQIKAGGVATSLSPFLCKTSDIEIEGDKEEIKKELADKMARCWWMFHEARYDEQLSTLGDQFTEMLGFEDDSNNCFLCYTAIINENEIEGGGISSDDMLYYLEDTDYPKLRDKTYLDYFQYYGGPGTVAIMENIVPNNVYGIAFFAREINEPGWTLADTFATGGLVLAGASCLLSAGITCGVIALGSASYLTAHGIDILDAKREFYGLDRPISMVILDDLQGLNTAECISGDLAGE